ncbi:MAG: hypothetical protein ACK5HU_05295 [Flavobacteriales bacterium]
MVIKKNTLIFYMICFLGLIIATLGSFVLPVRFFSDANLIINDPNNEIGLLGSYPLTIYFYNITYLNKLPTFFIGFIQFSFVIYFLIRLGIPSNFNLFTKTKNIITYLFILITAVYLCMPTKEFLTLLLILPIVFIIKNRVFSLNKTILFFFLWLIIIGIFFRPYFILISLMIIFFYFMSKMNLKKASLYHLAIGFLFVIFISFSYHIYENQYLSHKTRTEVNKDRINRNDASSIIIPPFETTTWYGEVTSIIYGFFSVNFPMNGLKHYNKPQILFFVFWQVLLLIIIFYRYNFITEKHKSYETWLFYFIISYFLIQGVFEPDLGSAVKHKAGIFLIIYYFLYYDQIKSKRKFK